MARTRKRSRSRKGRMPTGLARYWAGQRAKANPARKRRRHAKRNPIVRSHQRRSPRHVARRRSYRRNPGFSMPSTGFLMDAAMVTGGFFATRFAAGMVLPMLPMADQPLVRIAGKGAVAWGLGFLGGKFLGAKAGQLILLGGLVEALSDAVRTYVSPFVPALADGGMNSYPSISSYPNLSAYDNPYSVSAADAGFDE